MLQKQGATLTHTHAHTQKRIQRHCTCNILVDKFVSLLNSNGSRRHWAKIIIFLMILLGVGWVLNVVFFTEELFSFAYLTAVFIASQGIGIFFLFVVFSKKVVGFYCLHVHNFCHLIGTFCTWLRINH